LIPSGNILRGPSSKSWRSQACLGHHTEGIRMTLTSPETGAIIPLSVRSQSPSPLPMLIFLPLSRMFSKNVVNFSPSFSPFMTHPSHLRFSDHGRGPGDLHRQDFFHEDDIIRRIPRVIFFLYFARCNLSFFSDLICF